MTYEIIKQAILDKCSLTATSKEGVRHFSPHEIGTGKMNEVKIMTYQYAGASSKVLPPQGDWRCLELRDIWNVKRNQDSWHTGNKHSRGNTCIKRTDVTVRY